MKCSKRSHLNNLSQRLTPLFKLLLVIKDPMYAEAKQEKRKPERWTLEVKERMERKLKVTMNDYELTARWKVRGGWSLCMNKSWKESEGKEQIAPSVLMLISGSQGLKHNPNPNLVKIDSVFFITFNMITNQSCQCFHTSLFCVSFSKSIIFRDQSRTLY